MIIYRLNHTLGSVILISDEIKIVGAINVKRRRIINDRTISMRARKIVRFSRLL